MTILIPHMGADELMPIQRSCC